MLNSIGDMDKENFRRGVNGAVVSDYDNCVAVFSILLGKCLWVLLQYRLREKYIVHITVSATWVISSRPAYLFFHTCSAHMCTYHMCV